VNCECFSEGPQSLSHASFCLRGVNSRVPTFAMGEPSLDLDSPLVRSNPRAVTGAFNFAEFKANLTQAFFEHDWG